MSWLIYEYSKPLAYVFWEELFIRRPKIIPFVYLKAALESFDHSLRETLAAQPVRADFQET
jgi:hypothetical protein